MTEKRKTDRINTLNLLYILLNEEDTAVHQGMGRTLNLSETGILLETHFPIESEHSILFSIGLSEDLVEIKGKVAHHRQLENGYYITGIYFVEVTDAGNKIIQKYIQEYGQDFSAEEPTP